MLLVPEDILTYFLTQAYLFFISLQHFMYYLFLFMIEFVYRRENLQHKDVDI